MPPSQPLPIAIIGGGLCGISLGIALQRRNLSFTLYESRTSFTEIGAGINLSPAGMLALRLIDAPLGEKVLKLATRNAPPNENVWMDWRYGAPCANNMKKEKEKEDEKEEEKDRQDGELIKAIESPPTGSMTIHRRELLRALEEEMRGGGNVRFKKKFEGYEQKEEDGDGVIVRFADGSEERASVVVGCDGIHSGVRRVMFGAGKEVSRAGFHGAVVYRAVVEMERLVEAIGDEGARSSQILLGPGGYLIMYPVDSGRKVNCGFWKDRKGMGWDENGEWLIPKQGESFRRDAEGWGERARKTLGLFDPEPDLWASFEHGVQPERFTDGRVILIGDGAHSMPPHQGSGAATAVEDAYVLAEVLAQLKDFNNDQNTIELALQAVDETRQPRFRKVHRYSSEAGPRFFNFYEDNLNDAETEEWLKEGDLRLDWIWDFDLEAQAGEAKALFQRKLAESATSNGNARP